MDVARRYRALAKDPPNSHTPPYKHTQKHTYTPSIQAYTYKTKQKQNTQNQADTETTADTSPQTAPHKTAQKKYITLYNSKYCIR